MKEKTFEMKWHVAYTMPNSERKVALRIQKMGVEAYLPFQTVYRQWSDRRKRLEVPLFPNYVFVKVDGVRRGSLMAIKELIRFVSIEKKPVTVPEDEINIIRTILDQDVDVTQEDYFTVGMNVRIAHGPFAGFEGIVVKRNGSKKLIVKIEGLERAFSFSISPKLAEAVVTI